VEPAGRAPAAAPDPLDAPPPPPGDPAAADAAALPATDDAAPAAPARRKRRPRGAAAAILEPLDFAATVTAAEIAAADGFMAPPVAEPVEGGAVEAPPPDAPAPEAGTVPADGPKKRAPRRRKIAAGDLPVEAAPAAAPAPEATLPAPEPEVDSEPEPAPRHQRTDEERRQEAVDLVLETVEALITERGADDKIWGSMVKQTLKRRRPGFAESYYGFRSFNELLEDARDRGLLALDHDEKSGGYVIRLL